MATVLRDLAEHGRLLSTPFRKCASMGRCEDVIFFDGVSFDPSMKSIFFAP